MATNAFSPVGGYGSKVNGQYFVQTPQGGAWSDVPASTMVPNANYSQKASYAPLGASTTAATSSTSSGGGGDSYAAQLAKMNRNPAQEAEFQNLQAQQDPYAGVRNQISGAWDSYLNSLNDTSGYLNDQKGAQQGIADSQYNQGVNTINDQKASSLKDIANTTRNAFQAGNNYLGSLGAGDSSAANQYSFAINQQANKQTGDVNNFVNTQLQQLQQTHDQQVNQIAQWFAGKQQELKQQIAQGGLQKGQDLANLSKGILDQAMQATNALKANTQNQYNSLLSWAANNSSNIGQLQQNIAAIPQAMGQLNLGAGGVGATPTYGGAAVNPTNKKTDIFGNPIA